MCGLGRRRLLLLLLLAVGTADGHGVPRDTLACSQVGRRRWHTGQRATGTATGLTPVSPPRASPAASWVSATATAVGPSPARVRDPDAHGCPPSPSPDTDVLCGTELPGLGHGLALARLRLVPVLRCSGPAACSPCLEVRLRLALPPATGTGTGQPRRPAPSGIPAAEDSDEGGRWSPVDEAASSQPNITGLLLLSGHAYASSRCVAVEVQASPAPALHGRPLVRKYRVAGVSLPATGSPLALCCKGMWVLARGRLHGTVILFPVPRGRGCWAVPVSCRNAVVVVFLPRAG